MRNVLNKVVMVFLAICIVLANSYSVVVAEEIVITGNGSESVNEVTFSNQNTTTVVQNNNAQVTNTITVNSNTGGNNASENSDGAVTIETGNSTTKVAVENSVNVSEVTIDNCCTGEASGTTIAIDGNGSASENGVAVTNDLTTTVSVKQNAAITNTITGVANTGNNTANKNSGKVTIDTGSIKVWERIENGPINGYSIQGSSGFGNLDITVFGNASDSINTVNALFNKNTNIFALNDTSVANFIFWNLTTGNNTANKNTGDVAIFTGDIFYSSEIINAPINFGTIEWGNCCLANLIDEEDFDDPGEEPEKPGDEEKADEENPVVGGQILSDAASTVADTLEILGLSDTSGENSSNLHFMIGVAMILAGMKLMYETSLVRPAYKKLRTH